MCYNLLLCNLENIDINNIFNYQQDKVIPQPKIYIKKINKEDIKCSRKWNGLNLECI